MLKFKQIHASKRGPSKQVKANRGDRYENKKCRLCQEEGETQKHILKECKVSKEKAKQSALQMWPLLLTWFNFNPSMDM